MSTRDTQKNPSIYRSIRFALKQRFFQRIGEDGTMVARGTWKLTRDYWIWIVAIFFANLGAAMFEGSTVAVFGLAIKVLTGDVSTTFSEVFGEVGVYADRVVGPLEREELFLGMVFLALVTVLLRVLFKYTAAVTTALLQVRVFKKVWLTIFQQFLTIEYAQIAKIKTGDLQRYMNDSGGISNWLQQVNQMLGNLLTLIVYTVMLLWLSWQMALIAFALMIGITILVTKTIRKIRAISEELLPIGIEMNSQCIEFLGSLRLLRVFSRQQYAKNRMTDFADKNLELSYRLSLWNASMTPVMQLCSVTAVAVIILVSYYLTGASNSDMSIWPRLLTFLFVLNRLGPLVSTINDRRAKLQRQYPGVRRVNSMLRTDDKVYTVDGGQAFKTIGDGIEFRNVDFRYSDDERRVIRNLSFKIGKNQMVGIVGESGAGKSTIADLILRLYDVTNGQICVDGKELKEIDLKSWRNRIGVVNQESFIYNTSIRENIRFGDLDATEEDVVRAAKAAFAHEFITEFSDGYDTVVGNRGYRMSGGQCQRIAIARAIIRDPEILLLDEATSSLDSRSERTIQKAINQLRGQQTIIIIAHRLSTICMADRIFVLEKGSVVESGTHDVLMARDGQYASMWRLQSNGSS